MTHIKNFIDRVSALENRPGKDLIMSANEARMLRDDIAKLLADKVVQSSIQTVSRQESVIISGGSFK